MARFFHHTRHDATVMHAQKQVPSPLPGRPAGFWNRVSAATIDLLFLYAALRGLEAILAKAGVYTPFESAYLLAGSLYAIAGLRFRGTTIGKYLCALRVQTVSHETIGVARAVLRETAGKAFCALPLFAGFIAAAGPAKRGWHDRIAGTAVFRHSEHYSHRTGMAAGLGAALLIAAMWIVDVTRLYLNVRPILPTGPHNSRYAGRDPKTLTEVSHIDEALHARYASWLNSHAKPATDFVIEQCRRYPVVIIGEKHWQRRPLVLLSELLPRLYHDSGVRCVAAEWLQAVDSPLIERLLQGDTFDWHRAIEIARHNSWKTWGWREYMYVLEAAWRLNRSLEPGQPKMRIVGLDLSIDLPSVALAGFGDDRIDAPFWERLRVVRLIRELPKMFLRDAFMAREVERQLLQPRQRGIVWVGASHSTVNCRSPPGESRGWGRMGFMLKMKYPRQVYQIALHGVFVSPARSNAPSMIDRFIEGVMPRGGSGWVGFEVLDSPFDSLRDSCASGFRYVTEMSLGDLACAYLFLGPDHGSERCEWLEGYVTEAMFVENRAFYVAKGRQLGVDVRGATSANLALRRQ